MTTNAPTMYCGDVTNAGFGDFRPVSVEVDGENYGVDVYLGRGDAPEADGKSTATVELVDWTNGHGLLRRGLATEAQVWALVYEAEAEGLGIEPDTTIVLLTDDYGTAPDGQVTTWGALCELCREAGWAIPAANRDRSGNPLWAVVETAMIVWQEDRRTGQGELVLRCFDADGEDIGERMMPHAEPITAATDSHDIAARFGRWSSVEHDRDTIHVAR